LNWIYGIHAVQSLLKSSPERVLQLRLQRNRTDARLQKVQRLAEQQQIAVQWSTADELNKLVDGRHQGVAAECAEGETHDENYLFELLANSDTPPLFLVLDGVTDPHNLGACLRSADGAGVAAVIIPRDNSVGITPVVSKVACGAAETVPLVVVTNLARCLEKLRAAGVWTVGAAGEAGALVYDIDLKGPLALLLGAEERGLRRLTREQCDHLAKLPMAGGVSSLNVSVATGVFLYEAVRQRSGR
jgi:23S rRNA (guanosine2251-2'-O)-methyltransferase